jgi:transposase
MSDEQVPGRRRRRRAYTRTFKGEAMKLVSEQGREVSATARDLGIPKSTLLLWLRRSGWKAPSEPSVPMSEDPKALKVRIGELERQVRRLELEKEILKKATAFFASQNP